MRSALPLLAALSGCKAAHRSPGSDALDPLLGAWYCEQLKARLVITENKDGAPEVSFYTYERQASWPVKGAILADSGEVRFSVADADRPEQSVYFQVELLDRDTMLIRAIEIEPRRVDEDLFTAKRSDYPEGASNADESAAVRRRMEDTEVPTNVSGIRTAELAYDAAFDGFHAIKPWPRDPSQLTPKPIYWPPGSGFDTIGWRPDGLVRGSYSVDVSVSSTDFIVNGWIDADGDGVPAHWIATKFDDATRVTPEGVR